MWYAIMYCGCPILWASRLQSAFALSTMESKYVARLAALQYIILVMDLLKEIQDHVYNVEGNLCIKFKLCADNSGVSEPAKTAQYRPRTRHINATRQHFTSYMVTDLIQFTIFERTGRLETPSLTKYPRKTSLSFEDSYSGGTISPSKMKECEDMGFWLRLNWSDTTKCNSQICQG
jgi:hypothetical protein